MSHQSLLKGLALSCSLLAVSAWGQEMARVVSSTPVIQAVSVTEPNCLPADTVAAQCGVVSTVQNRITHFNVVYEYGGKTYNTALAQDPGQWLPIRVTPVLESAVPLAPPAPVWVAAPMPDPVVVAPYPYVYAPVYRPYPFSVHFGVYGGRGFRHWR